MRQLVALFLLLGMACTTTACVIEEPGHGRDRCSFWHPCR